MSRYKLWAVKDPKGKIIQESVIHNNKRAPWFFAVQCNKACRKIVNAASPTTIRDSFWLKKAGYSVVSVKAVEVK
jgi:hypothetical protein